MLNISEDELEEDQVVPQKKEAHWIVWGGWAGNHDQRIEDAQCSKCGYKHYTVYGSLSKLNAVCPKCGSSMDGGV